VIQFLSNLEGALAQGTIPRRFPHPAGQNTLLDAMKAPLENADEDDCVAVVAALRNFAGKKQIAAPAETSGHAAESWRAWFESARESLPDRITP
jgi:hypothetical protein